MTIRQKDGNEPEVTVVVERGPIADLLHAQATQPAAGECDPLQCEWIQGRFNKQIAALGRELATVTAEREAARDKAFGEALAAVAAIYMDVVGRPAMEPGESRAARTALHLAAKAVGEARAAQPNTGERARRPAQWMIARAKEVMAKAESGETSLTMVELIALAIAHAVTGEPATPVTIRRPAREVALKIVDQWFGQDAPADESRLAPAGFIDALAELLEADRRGEP